MWEHWLVYQSGSDIVIRDMDKYCVENTDNCPFEWNELKISIFIQKHALLAENTKNVKKRKQSRDIGKIRTHPNPLFNK